MDDTEDLGQKVCFTFNEEVTQRSKITIWKEIFRLSG